MSTLRQLKVFVTTAEHKKMSLAAKHLFISQPTISQIISDLEKEYNIELFERKGKELKITRAGELLLENAKKMVAINDALIQDMKNLHSIRTLRIGATMTIGNNLIANVAKGIESLHPDIDTYVKVTNTAHIEMLLLRNELDIALVEGIIHHPEIISIPVLKDELCVICSKTNPLANKTQIEISDLNKQAFILREKGSGTRAIFERTMDAHQIEYKIKWECASNSAIIDAVSNNLGIGFVSIRSVSDKVAQGKIHICHLKNVKMERDFFLSSYKNHPITSQINDFVTYIYSLSKASD